MRQGGLLFWRAQCIHTDAPTNGM